MILESRITFPLIILLYSVSILTRAATRRVTRRLLVTPSLCVAWLLKVLDLARTAGCPTKRKICVISTSAVCRVEAIYNVGHIKGVKSARKSEFGMTE